jgi:hypothetical protein
MACIKLKLDREYEFNSQEELDKTLEGIDVDAVIANPSKYRVGNGRVVENQLTEQQKQNIQELKQLEPAYTVASDEKVQEFLNSIYPDSQYQNVVWHGGGDWLKNYKGFLKNKNTEINQKSNTVGFHFGFKRGVAMEYSATSRGWSIDEIFINKDVEKLNIIKSTTLPFILNIKNLKNVPYIDKYEYLEQKTIDNLQKEGVDGFKMENLEIVVFEPEQITILSSPETIQKFQEFIGKEQPKLQRISVSKPLSKLPVNEKANAELLLNEMVNMLKAKFPNVRVEADYFEWNEMGRVKDGKVQINLNKATLSTPFHEFSHIWIALLKEADYKSYMKLAEQVEDMEDLINEIRNKYPELNEADLVEEAIVTLIGELTTKKYLNSKESELKQLYTKFISWLMNKLFGINDNPFSYTFNELIEVITDDLMNPNVKTEITTDKVLKLIKEVKNQKSDLISTAQDLLSFISGRTLDNNDNYLRKQAILMLGNANVEYTNSKGVQGFFLNSGIKKNYIAGKVNAKANDFIPYKSTDLSQREIQIYETLRESKKEDVQTTIDEIKYYYSNLGKQEVRDLVEADKVKYKNIKNLFPNYQSGDSILSYSELKTKFPELYNDTLDSPLLMVRVGKNKEVDIAVVSSESLQQTFNGGSIISNLGTKRSLFGKAFKNRLLSIFKSIKLSNDFINVAALHTMIVAMDIKSKGGKIDTLSVSQFKKGNINLERVDRSKYLFNLKNILTIDEIKERFEESGLYNLFYNKEGIKEEVFESSQYIKSYLESLATLRYNGKYGEISFDKEVLQYQTNTNIDTYNQLKNHIKKSLANLESTLITDTDKVKSKEYVLLAQSLFFLETNSKFTTNEYKEIGTLEQWVTSLKTTQNPFLNWWTKMWDDKRYLVVEQFLKYQEKRDVEYEKILKEKESGVDYFINNPNKFKDLLDGSYFKEDRLLNTEELKFKKYYMNHIKELAFLSWLNNSEYKYDDKLRIQIKENKVPKDKMDKFEKWYETTVWANGAIPILKTSISSAIFQGKAKESIEKIFERMISENPYYEEDNADFSKIPDFIYNQSMINNYEEKINNTEAYETDLRKISDIFTMQAYKQEFMKDLIPTFKAATILMKYTEQELGIDKEIAAREGIDQFDEGTIISRDVELLKNTFETLLFHRKKTIGNDETSKFINKLLVFTSTLTTFAAVALSPLTDIKTFTQSFMRILAQGMANIGEENLFDITQVPIMLNSFFFNPSETYRKAVDIGIKLRLLSMDEFDLLVNRFHTKETYSIFDSRNNFFLSRLGDNTLKLMIMTMLMKKDKSWDAWVYNEETKQYEYNESKDVRPKSVIELIKSNYEKETYLIKSKLDTSHDGNMRRTMEKRIADILGGFTDGTKTKLGMTHAGSAMTKFKVFFLNRIEKAIKNEVVNEQEIDYVDKDGKAVVMTKADIGYIKTLSKVFAGVSLYANQPAKVWNELTPEDHKNIYRIGSYTLMASLAMFASSMIDDDDKRINSIYESIISDMSVIDQANTALSFLKNPTVSVFYTIKLMDMMKEYILLDFDKGNTKAFNTIGLLKSYDFFIELAK